MRCRRFGCRVLAFLGGLMLLLGLGSAPGATAAPADSRVSVDVSRPSGTLRQNVLGLSFEASILSNDSLDPARGNVAQLLRTLNPTGQLRFGGNQMDTKTWYQPGGLTKPAWAEFVITPERIDALDALSRQTGWTVELGVNLLNFDSASVSAEVKYASARLGRRLDGVACGNEIDLYPNPKGPRWATQRALWQQCADLVKPYAKLVGGEEADGLRPDMLASVGDQLSRATSHWYPESNCNGLTFTVDDLLSAETARRSTARIAGQVAQARAVGLPFRITEGNSASCLRTPDAGNVYADSLWGVDELLLAAQEGAQGQDMHVPFEKFHLCSEPVSYTALCAASQADLDAQVLTANPLYYAMLAVGQLRPGRFLPVTVSSSTNLRAYAVRAADGDISVVLIQKDAPGGSPVTVALAGTGGRRPARSLQLTGGSLLAQPGDISLQGAKVRRDGTFAPGRPGVVPPGPRGYTITVPTGTATVITIPARR